MCIKVCMNVQYVCATVRVHVYDIMCVHASVLPSVHPCMHVCIHACACMRTGGGFRYTCMRACGCIWAGACLHAYVLVCEYTHIHAITYYYYYY